MTLESRPADSAFPTFQVAPPLQAADTRQRQPLSRTAVFVAHGMGQQIPFQTLDQVASRLLRMDEERSQGRPKDQQQRSPTVRSVKHGDQWLSRIEMVMRGGAGQMPFATDVYESYWAPVTEGKITLRDVIRFLAGAGRNGIRNAKRGVFMRWSFNRYESFPISIRSLFYLFIALACVVSLVVMNTTIVLVSAGRALLADTPRWLTPGLFADLTTVFNGVITAIAVFGLSLAIAVGLRWARVPARIRAGWGWISAILLLPTLGAIVAAGASLPLLFYAHVRGTGDPGRQLMHDVLSAVGVDAFNAAFDAWAWLLAIALLAIVAGRWLLRLAVGLFKDLRRSSEALFTAVITVVFAGIVGVAAWMAWSIATIPGAGAAVAARTGLAWVLLVAVSAYLRLVLVQYLGDVAAYVMPYKLDAFSDVRREIKESAHRVLAAIYSMKREDGSFEYDKVVVVGHSLGSVVAYDTLNQVIREDLANDGKLDVVRRTPLFLTFGSPLDKTAFIFSLQGRDTSEAREALAASVQPMIQKYAYRPTRWVNVYSPWDIISGALNFYDLQGEDSGKAVLNQRDPDAATLIIAHTEYWNNAMVFDWMYQALAGEVPAKTDQGVLATAAT